MDWNLFVAKGVCGTVPWGGEFGLAVLLGWLGKTLLSLVSLLLLASSHWETTEFVRSSKACCDI